MGGGSAYCRDTEGFAESYPKTADAVGNFAGFFYRPNNRMTNPITGEELSATEMQDAGMEVLTLGIPASKAPAAANWVTKMFAKLGGWLSNLGRQATRGLGEQIANGHAFAKHVIEKGEFKDLGIKTKEQFGNFIQGIVDKAKGSNKKELERGRSAFWDNDTGTVVIRDPNHIDKGTAFRPDEGKKFFDNLE